MKNKEYYIGWNDKIPDRNKKALKKILIPTFVLIPVIAFVLVFFTKPFTDHTFELGSVKEFTGVYFGKPFPVLFLDKGQFPKGFDPYAMLVGYGKSGATGLIHSIESFQGSLSGKKIKIQGTLIYGDGKILIELTKKENSLLDILNHNKRQSQELLKAKNVELKGEILDPKCWFGAMKPAEGKVHKSCAIRCISGGIPPVFRTHDGSRNTYYVLKGEKGRDISREILQYIGEPLLISGKVFKQNGWQIININPKEIKHAN